MSLLLLFVIITFIIIIAFITTATITTTSVNMTTTVIVITMVIIVITVFTFTDGLDFYFTTEAFARQFLDFLNSVVPCRWTQSKKLISHDIHSNIYNYKFTFR